MRSMMVVLLALGVGACGAPGSSTYQAWGTFWSGVIRNAERYGVFDRDENVEIDRSGCNYRETAELRKKCWAEKRAAEVEQKQKLESRDE